MLPAVLTKQYAMNGRTIAKNVEGMSEDQALVRAPGGSCALWVLGHILASRNGVHALLKLPPALPDATAAPFKRGAPADGLAGTGTSLSDLQAAWRSSQAALEEALPRLTAGDLERRLTMPAPLGEGAVAEHLGFLSFHESYHAGQLGILRRLAGLPGAIG